jgi:uncharacterized protein YndB with AHSA1/START domain
MGVRRTFALAGEDMWALLVSGRGLQTWLGEAIALEPGSEFRLSDGTSGKLTVCDPPSHLRLSWQRPDWSSPSIVQVRVIPARTASTVSFHQEKLAAASEREAMLVHWRAVLDALGELVRQTPTRG